MINAIIINYISFNTSVGRIKFQNGTMMKSTTEANYLGAVMNDNDKAETSQEIRRRILSTMPILKRLDIFWNKTNCGKSWKWLVYNSIIISRLLYGLESLQTTDNTGKLLNTFQLKGLNLHTTYIDRNNSNEFVYQRANEVVGAPSQGPLCKIRHFLATLLEKLFLGTLLGNLFLETLPGNFFREPYLWTCSWETCLGTCSWEPVAGNLAWEPLPENIAWEPACWEPGNTCLKTCSGNLVLLGKTCSWKSCLGNLLGTLLGHLFLQTSSWKHLLENMFWELCFAWEKHVPGNLAWETVPGNLENGSWNPCLQSLFLGTLLGNLFLETSSWEPLLGNLFLWTLGTSCWEPLPGSWEPCLETLLGILWEPCLGALPGNPVPNLAPCGFGCSEGFSWKRKPFPGTRFPADLAAPTCSGTFTMAEDPKLTLLGKNVDYP